jgi:hypothetical protein
MKADRGGGSTVRRITLSAAAAQIVRNACQLSETGRQSKEAANDAASRLIESHSRIVQENLELRAKLAAQE